MTDAKTLCSKIRDIYPEIGQCGVNVDIFFDDGKGSWVVELAKGEHLLATHIDEKEATACLEGEKCLSLGVQVAQLLSNVKNA